MQNAMMGTQALLSSSLQPNERQEVRVCKEINLTRDSVK